MFGDESSERKTMFRRQKSNCITFGRGFKVFFFSSCAILSFHPFSTEMPSKRLFGPFWHPKTSTKCSKNRAYLKMEFISKIYRKNTGHIVPSQV